jgi:hypothetical protein
MLFASHAFSQVWIQLAPTGTLPSPWLGVYDTGSNRIMGLDGDPSGVWILTNANGLGGAPQWSQIAALPDPAQGFPAGRGPSAVYDAANNRMIIFGGCLASCGAPVNEVWVLTNANGLGGTPTWLKLLPGGALPSPRANHSAVYDSASNKMIIFGGQNGCCNPQVTYSDAWVISNANGLGGAPTWAMLNPSGGPPPQANAAAFYDSVNNRMTVFGGSPNHSNAGTNAVWVLTNANGSGGSPAWTNLIPEGSAGSPPVRVLANAGYDPSSNRMTMFGGWSGSSFYNDTWVLTYANGLGGTTAWTQLFPTGGPPLARLTGVGVFDVASDRMIISGGENDCCVLSDTWVLTNASGLPLDTVGPITSNVAVSPNPVALNTNSTLTATVDDSTTGGSNIASAYYTISGGALSQLLLTPSTAVTTQASASLAPFTQSNVYNVCVHGTDSAGNTGADACILLPVYDPNGSFVTGGGQVTSPSGADLLNPSAAGKAAFGFVSKYLPGKSTPSGNLQFQFKEGNLNFTSTSMDWLVVTGEPRAKFHGTGTVNGANVCNFEVDAWAGSFAGNVDAFGLKITSCSNGGDRYSLPATALTKGSIVIHK